MNYSHELNVALIVDSDQKYAVDVGRTGPNNYGWLEVVFFLNEKGPLRACLPEPVSAESGRLGRERRERGVGPCTARREMLMNRLPAVAPEKSESKALGGSGAIRA